MTIIVWYLVGLAGGVVGIITALFAHELGHTIPLILAGGNVSITLGSESGRTFVIGPIKVTIGVDGIVNTLRYGRCEYEGVYPKHVLAISILGGPFVSIVIVATLGAVLLARGTSGPLSFGVEIVFYHELIRAVLTIVPMTYSHEPYNQSPSDGKRFLRLLNS